MPVLGFVFGLHGADGRIDAMLIQIRLLGAKTSRDALPRLLYFCDGPREGVVFEVGRTIEIKLDVRPLNLSLLQKIRRGTPEVPARMTVRHHLAHPGHRVTGSRVNLLPVRQGFRRSLLDAVQATEDGKI